MAECKVLLTDMDGVLRNFPREHSQSAEQELGLEAGSLLAAAFQKKHLDLVITGGLTDEEWRLRIIEELSVGRDRARVVEVIDRWTEFPGELDSEVCEIYRKLRSTRQIALLTNATTKLNRDLRVLGLGDLFHHVFNTCEIGFAKPDVRAFEFVLKTLGCSASDVFFVDDRSENIEVARRLGFQFHLFKGHAGLREALSQT